MFRNYYFELHVNGATFWGTALLPDYDSGVVSLICEELWNVEEMMSVLSNLPKPVNKTFNNYKKVSSIKYIPPKTIFQYF